MSKFNVVSSTIKDMIYLREIRGQLISSEHWAHSQPQIPTYCSQLEGCPSKPKNINRT